jgi:MraZ protein
MFLGTHQHSLDSKGRVILPASFRDELEEGAYITTSLDGCLAVWAPEEFKRVAEDLMEKARRGERERNVVRAFAAGAAQATPDRQGRITIPANLREFAGLEREVVVTGVINRIEIWDSQRWARVDSEGLQDVGI